MATMALGFLLAVVCLHGTVGHPPSGMEGMVRLIVGRTGNPPAVNHSMPPPAIAVIPFSPVFDKQFLKQVYSLKARVETVRSARGQVSLRDVCVTNNHTCVVESLWSYFQDRVDNIDRKAMDKSGFFVLADYLDHLQACFRKAWLTEDGTALGMSCRPASDYITSPDHTLFNFTTTPDWIYRDASHLVVTFHVRVPQKEGGGVKMLTAWLDAVRYFLTHIAFHDYPNITTHLEEPYRLTNRP